jgi:hypothetical protein
MVEVALHPLSVPIRTQRIGISKKLEPVSVVVLEYRFYKETAHVAPKIGRGIANPDTAALNGCTIIVLKAMLRGRSNRISIRLVLPEEVSSGQARSIVEHE